MCACQLSMLIHLQQGFEYSFTKYLNPPHAFISWRVSCLLWCKLITQWLCLLVQLFFNWFLRDIYIVHHREKHCSLQAVLMRKWVKVHGQLWSITILSDFPKRFHIAKCPSNIQIYSHFADLQRRSRIIILLRVCCKINWGCPTGDSANSPTSGDVSDTWWIPYQCGRRNEL